MSVNIGDHELLLNDTMKDANRGVDDLIAHGSAVLDSLRLQGANLGSIKQKIFDVGQTVSIIGPGFSEIFEKCYRTLNLWSLLMKLLSDVTGL
jgi:hypothetical protein